MNTETSLFASAIDLPILAAPAAAGFPSPADDFAENRINLEEYLIPRRASTFLMRASGCSMQALGIHDGDLLIVDRSLPVTEGCVVIAMVDGGFAVKQWRLHAEGVVLSSAPPGRTDISLTPGQEVTIWGVVRWSIHRMES
ncbi:MAG: translesion error-prone DNA polymerase V autoproteolytic subunit [Magnetococcales bacterium]|nr:translesion error-prone DNA polymerase V autoproteolytic subunit [Magnetococcales bacterium]